MKENEQLPKTTEYTAEEVAMNMHILNSYNDLIRAASKGESLLDVKYVREDLQLQLSALSKNELIVFNKEVKASLEIMENQSKIKNLRQQISKKQDRIDELLGK